MSAEHYILKEPVNVQDTDVLSINYLLNSYGELCIENIWVQSRFDPPN